MSQSASTVNYSTIQSDLQDITSTLDISESVYNGATEIYKLSYKHNLYRGRSKDVLLATTLYISCQIHNNPIPPKKIANATDTTESDIFSTYRHFKKNLSLPIPTVDPTQYINQVRSEIDLSASTISKSITVAESLDTQYISGKSVAGISGGVIYFVTTFISDETITQSEIAEIIGTTEVTIRNRYKEIKLLYESSKSKDI